MTQHDIGADARAGDPTASAAGATTGDPRRTAAAPGPSPDGPTAGTGKATASSDDARRRSPAGVVLRQVGRRLLELVLVLWGAATITFIAVKSIPGDPVAIISGGENIVDAEQRAVVTAAYGLDQPLIVQYLRYLGRAFTGDFGESYAFRSPVVEVIGEAIVPTLQLALTGFVLAILIATVTALLTSGARPGVRFLASGTELVLLSTPVYWIGIILLLVFSFWLGWFPVVGADGPGSLVLPALALSFPLAAIISQVMRDGIEHALDQPFALTVRSRGVGEIGLRVRHALRHSLLAVSTIAGTMLGGVLTGSILTETVFGRPGIGQITLLGISSRDMPLILGLVVLSALLYSLINLVIDLGYALIDPRIRDGVTA